MSKLLHILSAKAGLDLTYLMKNGNWVSLRFLVVSVTGFFITFVFSHFGSRTLLGEYQLVLSIMSTVSLCSFLGLNAAALEAVVKGRPAGVLRAMRLITSFSLIGVPIMIGIGAWYAFNKDQLILGKALVTSGILFPLFYGLSSWNVWYEGKLLFKESSLRIILQNIVLTGSLGLSVFAGLNVLGLIAVFLLTTIAFQAFYFWEINLRTLDRTQDDIDIPFGISVSLQKFASGLSGNLPPIFIAFLFGVESLAIYFISYYVIGALSAFLNTLLALYTPILFRGGKLDHKSIIFNNLFIGLAAWAIFYIFLKYLFVRIYGEAYSASLYLGYSISFLLFFLPFHTYLVSFFSTRRKNTFLIIIFTISNIFGILALYGTKQLGFVWATSSYMYTLEICTTVPLFVYYLFHIRRKNQ